MRKSALLLAAMLVTIISSAQTKLRPSGNLQAGILGGVSLPGGSYKGSVGHASNGFTAGLFLDKYFRGNTIGIGIDARYLKHSMPDFLDTATFKNGTLTGNYNNERVFQHFAIAVGPTFKTGGAKFTAEFFIKGGVLFQQFPNYNNALKFTPYNSGTSLLLVRQTTTTSDKSKSWMGLGGARLSYHLSPVADVFISGEYVRSFGNDFLGTPSRFEIAQMPPIAPIAPDATVTDPYKYYNANIKQEKTFIEAINITAGVKFNFSKKPKAPKVIMQKDVVVMVKDRLTGLPLSGVKVVVAGNGKEYVSFTGANGMADRIQALRDGRYSINGEKNNIPTTKLSIDKKDFEMSGNYIYKELYHDDPRFTLIGVTKLCETDKDLPGISTVLTHSKTAQNISQISDKFGKFIYQLEPNASYTLVANQAGKYSQTELIHTSGMDRSKTIYVTLRLDVCDIQQGKSWVLKNIFYDFDKSDIRPDAAIVLDNIVNIMKNNPSLSIELSSHTDSRGNDAYNMRLSQKRAEAAVTYLTSHGITNGRMEAKGYGESKLVNNCGNDVNCTEDEHQQNRRTEIKLLKY